MNKPLIVFELREMREHLSELIEEMESGKIDEDNWAALAVNLGRVMDHLCYAWNARDHSFEELAEEPQEESERKMNGVPNFGIKRYLVDDAI